MLTVSGFDVISVLGRGVSGSVFLARSDATRREVALKVLPPPLGRAELRRFEAETAAWASLAWHPHVVQLLDAGVEADGRMWLAMERLGATLQQVIEREPRLAPARVTDIGVQVAGALEAAHAIGLLHRDVKPSNILIAAGGTVRLSDFAVASLLDPASAPALPLIASFGHMAPELLDGHPATESSDQFAFAATLTALLTGWPLGSASDDDVPPAAVTHGIVQGECPELRVDVVPTELVDDLSRAMHPDSAERFASVRDLADRLLALQRTQRWPETRYVGPNDAPTDSIALRYHSATEADSAATLLPIARTDGLGLAKRRSLRRAGSAGRVVVIGALAILAIAAAFAVGRSVNEPSGTTLAARQGSPDTAVDEPVATAPAATTAGTQLAGSSTTLGGDTGSDIATIDLTSLGFTSVLPYEGDCGNRAEGTVCVAFSDGYVWLVTDSIRGSSSYSIGEYTVEVSRGFGADYEHVVGTDFIRLAPPS